ncbi:hypothetical protein [Pendulispora albinea]|uniref:Uncharacterized protein n=1 Tax=Pendulispora albinea TaxID=2741071 RepID=A0ABZ2M480_9BACT
MHAAHVPLKVDVLGVVSLDFKGGMIVRVEDIIKGGKGGLGGVKLKVIGFEVSASSPMLGAITLAQADVNTTPLSPLELVSKFPPKFTSALLLDFEVTVERPPNGGPPLVLANTKTATLFDDSLTVFPPQGSVYQLQQPVDLAPADAPTQVIGQLLQFPVTVSHNP